jgi:hypothetical protein
MSGETIIRIGDQDWDKPYDPSCSACTSPWLGQIDTLLASGWTPEAIVARLRGRKPGPPRVPVIRSHTQNHLAQPHMEQRAQFERSQGRDINPGIPSPHLRDVTDAALQRVYTGMAAGTVQPPLRDVIAARRLLQQIEADEAGVASREAVQQALIEIFEIARAHLQDAAWEAFARDVYNSDALGMLMRQRPAVTIGES